MSVAALKSRFREDPSRVMISVHRGRWNPLPENSLAAIRAAAAWDVVEVDLRLASDGTAYLMHDDTLERTANHPAASSSKTAAGRSSRISRATPTRPDSRSSRCTSPAQPP